MVAQNVSVNGDFLFDRHLTEWLRTGKETGNETGNEAGNVIGNETEVIQMIQKWSRGQVTGQVAGQVMRLSEVMSEVAIKLSPSELQFSHNLCDNYKFLTSCEKKWWCKWGSKWRCKVNSPISEWRICIKISPLIISEL